MKNMELLGNSDILCEEYIEFKSFQAIKKAFESGELDTETFEKAQRTYIDNTENKRLKRVGKPYGGNKQDEPGKGKDKKPETIENYAKKASDEALQSALKESKDEKVKEAAQKELDARNTQTDNKNEISFTGKRTETKSDKIKDLEKELGIEFKLYKNTGSYYGEKNGLKIRLSNHPSKFQEKRTLFGEKGIDLDYEIMSVADMANKINGIDPIELLKSGDKIKHSLLGEMEFVSYDKNKELVEIKTKDGEIKKYYAGKFTFDKLTQKNDKDKEPPPDEKSGADTKKESVSTIEKLVEDLSDKYKNVVAELMKPENYADEKKYDKYSKQQLEYARYISRTNQFKNINKESEIKKTTEFLGLKDEKEIKDFFGDGNVLGIKVEIKEKTCDVKVLTEDAYIDREFTFDKYKEPIDVEMYEFILNPDLDKSKGKGCNIFNNQVQSFKKLGFKKLKTTAAKTDIYNGYYTWARLGYQIDKKAFINIIEHRADDKDIKSVKSISELMSFEKGRKFWKEKGSAFEGIFDLSNNSMSMFTLNEYMKGKQNEK